MPAVKPPTERPPAMYASWLTVDHASTRLRSSSANAASAAPSIVMHAITASTSVAT